MVDNSDQQYAGFRDNVPYLLIVMILHPVLRRMYDILFPTSDDISQGISKSPPNRTISSYDSDSRLNQRISFDAGFSLLFIFALHGFSAVKVLLILYINYNVATRLERKYVPVVTWIFNIGILFANELGRGYPFTNIADATLPWSTSEEPKSNWGTVLDSYGGLIPRWEILFNVTVLRLMSFNFDYYWSLDRNGSSAIEVCDSYNTSR